MENNLQKEEKDSKGLIPAKVTVVTHTEVEYINSEQREKNQSIVDRLFALIEQGRINGNSFPEGFLK